VTLKSFPARARIFPVITPQQIRGAQAMLGITQAGLAKRAGLSATGLLSVETGASDQRRLFARSSAHSRRPAWSFSRKTAPASKLALAFGFAALTLRATASAQNAKLDAPVSRQPIVESEIARGAADAFDCELVDANVPNDAQDHGER
jgi:DNA-binding XRE family transcriptional regulator